MVAVAGGKDVRCATYATFGTQALSDAAVRALDARQACLLANHGMLCIGPDLDAAVRLTIEVEELARQYIVSTALGEPLRLDDDEMAVILEKFRTYGKYDGED